MASRWTPGWGSEICSELPKQYHKEGRALRTDITINDTHNLGVGRLLGNLDKLKLNGFSAHRRLLDVQPLRCNCLIGAETFDQLQRPRVVAGQRASALRFNCPRMQAPLDFRLLPTGFDSRQLSARMGPLLGLSRGPSRKAA